MNIDEHHKKDTRTIQKLRHDFEKRRAARFGFAPPASGESVRSVETVPKSVPPEAPKPAESTREHEPDVENAKSPEWKNKEPGNVTGKDPVLQILENHPAGLRVKEIGSMLNINQPSVRQRLSSLMKAKKIRRWRGDDSAAFIYALAGEHGNPAKAGQHRRSKKPERRPRKRRKQGEARRMVVKLLKNHPDGLKASDILKETGMRESTVSYNLNKLKEQGKVIYKTDEHNQAIIYALKPNNREMIIELLRNHPKGLLGKDISKEIGIAASSVRTHMSNLAGEGMVVSTWEIDDTGQRCKRHCLIEKAPAARSLDKAVPAPAKTVGSSVTVAAGIIRILTDHLGPKYIEPEKFNRMFPHMKAVEDIWSSMETVTVEKAIA